VRVEGNKKELIFEGVRKDGMIWLNAQFVEKAPSLDTT